MQLHSTRCVRTAINMQVNVVHNEISFTIMTGWIPVAHKKILLEPELSIKRPVFRTYYDHDGRPVKASPNHESQLINWITKCHGNSATSSKRIYTDFLNGQSLRLSYSLFHPRCQCVNVTPVVKCLVTADYLCLRYSYTSHSWYSVFPWKRAYNVTVWSVSS